MQPPWGADHDPLTPQGQIDQVGRLAHGLRYNRRGRQRAAKMLLGLLLAIGIAVAGLVLTYG
jgi:hypothetical protein